MVLFKSKVFNPQGKTFQTLDELREKIEEKIPLIPCSMFRDSFRDFRKRVEKCLEKAGGHFEHDIHEFMLFCLSYTCSRKNCVTDFVFNNCLKK